MSVERERPQPYVPQDPAIPGWKTPEQQPPQDEPDVDDVPESPLPDVDDEGHQDSGARDG